MSHSKDKDSTILRSAVLDDRSIQSPTDYRYIKALRFKLKILNSWPGMELGEKGEKPKTILLYLLALYNLFFLILNFIYLIKHTGSNDFFVMCHAYITTFMGVVSTSRISHLPLSKRYRNVVKYFISDIHLFHRRNDSEFAMKMHIKVHKYSNMLTICLMAQMAAGLYFFQVIPIYNNYSHGLFATKNLQNATFELPVYFSLPLNSTTNFNDYVITCLITATIAYFCSSIICMFDLLLSLMVIHVWGHFQILLHNIDDIPKPSTVDKDNEILMNMRSKYNAHLYSEEELIQISDKLKKCINYHRLCVKFINEISHVFGPMLFVYYGFHQTCGCLLLLICSPMTGSVLIRFGPLTVILFQQLIQLSVVFELIGTASGKLKDAVYNMPWECMDIKNKKTVLIFLMNVQKPIHVKAMGIANVGVTSMAAILKTSLSYFTFLLTVAK